MDSRHNGGLYVDMFLTVSSVNVACTEPYSLSGSSIPTRPITGTTLNLGDDSIATLPSPFPIQFGEAASNISSAAHEPSASLILSTTSPLQLIF